MSRNESNLSKISHAVVSLCSDSKRSPADVDNDLEEEQLRSMAVTTTSPAKPATGLGVTLPDLDGDRQVLERARRILQLRPSSPTHSRASSVSSSSSSLRSSSPPYHDPSSFPSSAASISSSSINDAHFPLHGPSSSPPLLSRKNHDGGSKLDGRSSEITNDNDRRRRKYSPGSSGSHSDERKALARLLTVYEDMVSLSVSMFTCKISVAKLRFSHTQVRSAFRHPPQAERTRDQPQDRTIQSRTCRRSCRSSRRQDQAQLDGSAFQWRCQSSRQHILGFIFPCAPAAAFTFQHGANR